MIRTDVGTFDPGRVCDSGQIFRMYRTKGPASFDLLAGSGTDENEKWFTVFSADRRLAISQEGTQVRLWCDKRDYEEYWKHYLDMDRDYESLRRRIDKKDAFLTRAAEAGRGLRILNQDLFETIISFIISQQKQIPLIRKCIEALCERFGEKHLCEGQGNRDDYWYGFPRPEVLAAAGEDGLKGLSLGYRERYIHETSVLFLEKERALRKSVESKRHDETKKILLSFTGIGEKVADCISLFACENLDAFPVDTHIISIMEREYPVRSGTDEGATGAMSGEKIKMTPGRASARAQEVFGRYKGFEGLVQQWIFAYEINRRIE